MNQLHLCLDQIDHGYCLNGDELSEAKRILIDRHYTHSIPSGKSHYFRYDNALIVFSIPANRHLAHAVVPLDDPIVWELSRLWAPDGHVPNLLTRAISVSCRSMLTVCPGIDAFVSYADPNVGHSGGVYRAASWICHGHCEDGRYYRRDSDGQVFARRSFHSGGKGMKKAEIEARGFTELKLPGKIRFVRYISKRTRSIRKQWEAK